jgi:hypothetical protein
VTESERLAISILESSYVTGDLVKDERIAELWRQTYPRMAGVYNDVGSDYEGGVQAFLQGLQLDPNSSITCDNLARPISRSTNWMKRKRLSINA